MPSFMQEAIAEKQGANEICKRYIFGGMAAGISVCRTCGYPRKIHYSNQRGPQISSREVLPLEELEADTAMPWSMFAAASQRVVYDLMQKVGYDQDVKMSIKKLHGDHPEAPGYEIVAKVRLP